MKNKKGFTLVELLGAIVILALLSLIAIPAVTNVVKSNKQKLYDAQLEGIRSSAKAWSSDNINLLPENGCIVVYLDQLKAAGFVENDIKNPKNGELLENNIYVEITANGNTYDYVVKDSGVSLCNSVISG